MKFTARIPVTAGLLVILAATVGCNKLKSRDQLNKGIQAFKNSQYEQAVDHFQTAVQLDPSDQMTQLYLATSYAYQVVPNLTTPENLAVAQKAIDAFQKVLDRDPKDVTALKQIASIYRNVKKYEPAKDYEKRVIALDPNDAEANYTIGWADWDQAYNNTNEVLGALKPPRTEDGNGDVGLSKADCQKLQQTNGPLIQEGLPYLQRAVEINPTYEEAMSIINLTYRQKAAIECGNDAARKADLATATSWTNKQMAARKTNEANKEKKLGGGVTMQ
jgi:tetratricopeptide (TPR) repeat protein